MTDIIDVNDDNPTKEMTLIHAYTYGISLLQNQSVFQAVFREMESTWLSLYTQEETCPIVEQTGTFVKRKLVKQYAAVLVKTLSGVSECPFIAKLYAGPDEFWTADEVVTQIADVPTKDHADLFRAVLCQVYGVSNQVYQILMSEDVTWLDVYQAVSRIYPSINLSRDVDLDGKATPEALLHALTMYLFVRQGVDEDIVFC